MSYAIVAQAQTPGTPSEEEIEAKGITFPVPELGNCSNKSACRDYCSKSENMEVCIKFAKDHGLMNKEEAAKAEKFRERVQAGKGPGGCNSPQSCESFCSNINNIETCLKFAEDNGFKDKKIEEGKKISAYLKSGGKMPGGCTSEASCKSYCSDFNHAEECFAFAEKVGLDTEEEAGGPAGEKLEPEKFKKFIELAKKGETPGGCKSKEQCESYCQSESNREECIAFGEKMGFIDKKKAELFRKTGGKGPGGCNSEASCKAHCNDPANQEACFKFAEEHGLIGEEEIKHAKEGFVRLRQGLENAPPEVASCLKSTLGPNIIEDIQAGKLTPGQEIGDRVKSCFEKFGHQGDPKEAFSQAPPEMISCVKEKLGDVFEKIKSGEAMPTPEMGDAFRVCGEQMRLLQGPPGEEGREGGEGFKEGRPDVSSFLRSAPPGVAGCLKEKLGGDFEKIQSGESRPGPEIGEKLKSCFQEFRPEAGTRPPGFGEEHGPIPEGIKPAGFQEFKERFSPGSGLIKPGEGGFTGPGGCKSPEECRAYCESNPSACGIKSSEGFSSPPPPSDSNYPTPLPDQLKQQYDQQYQTPPPTEPTSPPPTTEPAPAPAPEPTPVPTTEPAPQTQRQTFLGTIIQGVRTAFGF